eukprot:9480119-Lingulodinium_polyedra.AAC.1
MGVPSNMTLRSCVLSALRAMPAQVRSLQGTATKSATKQGTTTDAWQAHAGRSHKSVSDQSDDHLLVSGLGSPTRPGMNGSTWPTTSPQCSPTWRFRSLR